jgi:hypothetical protein
MGRGQSSQKFSLPGCVDLEDGTRMLLDATVEELVSNALQAGLNVCDLNRLLDAGMGLDELVDAVKALLLDLAA